MAKPAMDVSLGLRRDLVEVVEALLDGSLGVLEGAREVEYLARRHPNPHLAIFQPFIGVASESDRFPLGDVRQHWNPEALARLDSQAESYVASIREGVMSDCRDVLSVYGHVIPREQRAGFEEAVRTALMEEWDPIGVRGIAGAYDEYWSYAAEIAEMLDLRATRREIFDHLWWLETEQFGLGGYREATERFADSLIRLRDSHAAGKVALGGSGRVPPQPKMP